MKPLRIAFFAVLLFLLQVAVGASVTVAVGVEDLDELVTIQFIVGTLVSICVFARMAWSNSTRPYLSAFMVGILATLLGAISLSLVIGDISWWNPTVQVVDIAAMLIAVIVGASLGIKLKRWRSADL